MRIFDPQPARPSRRGHTPSKWSPFPHPCVACAAHVYSTCTGEPLTPAPIPARWPDYLVLYPLRHPKPSFRGWILLVPAFVRAGAGSTHPASNLTRPAVSALRRLESGPRGKKVQELKKVFDVLAPDMEMSLSNLRQPNSVARNMFRTTALSIWMTVTAILTVGSLLGVLSITAWVAVLISAVFSLFLAPFAFRQALDLSMMKCLAIQQQALTTFRPDVVVGSSWGGAIASLLLFSDAWPGTPMILLAPAGGKIMRYAGRNEQWLQTIRRPLPPGQQLYILHGDSDETVCCFLNGKPAVGPGRLCMCPWPSLPCGPFLSIPS